MWWRPNEHQKRKDLGVESVDVVEIVIKLDTPLRSWCPNRIDSKGPRSKTDEKQDESSDMPHIDELTNVIF